MTTKNPDRLYPLIPFEPQQSFETYYAEIDSGTVFQGQLHEGNVYEYIFVISGKILPKSAKINKSWQAFGKMTT